MAKPKNHKRGCRCVICSRMSKPAKKRTATKRAKKTARKKNPATSPAVKAGKLDRWIPAKSVRVRRVNGKTLVDIKR